MAIKGLLRFYSVRPVHSVGDDGRMALSDHLRELRGRVMRAVTAWVVALVVALFFFDQIFALVFDPYKQAAERLGGGTDTQATIAGVGGPLVLYLKLCGMAALVVTSPYWLHQIWSFILPGLHAHERKWSRVFAAFAGPLFMIGVLVGYLTLPKGLEILIGFTQADLTNLVEFGDYFSFLVRTLLVFGISFEIPVFLILLNLTGLLPGRVIGQYRPWFVIGIFVFAAIATPSTDPFTMLFLALPMCALVGVSEVIARVLDKRKAARSPYSGLSPDEPSPI
ncbi:sec-independent protein translocase protein TatC [Nocardioides zeae]|uniref:Sec-independent protein translocase protein TatC n=2 Tax=Nocardioides zeae TaxID=1457234 RepID=A0AAJ1U286_9ACTN|nr:twin-arginine translocase subunit TatC [Nocardioides zeae]MDQ1104148.1 sec-independent protein translocase protein TatC [Nocardioides zeae]MDR6176162.1 sec-independent protein translocase protein TatC [Nocardioides zeae]MDR6210309.1 sec-independent protein translocase protein TatC [Nocardioides zeae]